MHAVNRWAGFVIGLFALQLFTQQPAAGQSYTVEALTVEDVDKAVGPNVNGDAAWRFREKRAFKKEISKVQAEVIQELPKGDPTVPNGINDSGDVVGSANTATNVHAFLATSKTGTRDLGTLPGDSASEAFGVNNLGQVVGYSSGPSGARAVLWIGSTAQSLGTLPGGSFSKAFAINERGTVVGMSASPVGASTGFRVIALEEEPFVRVEPGGPSQPRMRAFIWKSGNGMKDLGTLPWDTDSAAFGVNNRDDVVGYSLGPTGMRAFLWRSAAGMQSLGALPGHTTTKAVGINEKGQVVGTSGSDQARAVLWESDRVPRDLNGLITGINVVLTEAVGINARGQILALGRTGHDARLAHHEGPNRVFLLTPSGSK